MEWAFDIGITKKSMVKCVKLLVFDRFGETPMRNTTRIDTTALLILAVTMLLAVKQIFLGFSDVDEADIAFDIFKLLQNLATERNIQKILWIDGGLNGPLHYYLYALVTLPLSYILGMPFDMALRLAAIATIPFSGYFFYRAVNRMAGKNAAIMALVTLMTASAFITVNTKAIGEPWYTLLYSISLFFITRATKRRDVYISFAFFALGLMCKYTFAPLIFLHFFIVITQWKTIGPKLYDLLLGALILLSGFLPLGLSLLISGPSFLYRFSQIEAGSHTYVIRFLQTSQRLYNSIGPFHLVFIIMGLSGLIVAMIKGHKNARILLLGTGTVYILYTIIGTRSIRYVYPLVLPFSIIAGMGSIQLMHSIARIVPILTQKKQWGILLVCSLILGVWGYMTSIWSTGFHESDDRAVARYVLSQSSADQTIAALNSASFYIFGLRPMALNLLLDSVQSGPEGMSIDYKMNGIRRMELGNIFMIITKEKYIKNPDWKNLDNTFTRDRRIGDFIVYRNADKNNSEENYRFGAQRYDLRSIVKRIQDKGTLQPGMLIETY